MRRNRVPVQGFGYLGLGRGAHEGFDKNLPRGSRYTTIRELGPQMPYYRRNYGSQFPGCICGPSGLGSSFEIRFEFLKADGINNSP